MHPKNRNFHEFSTFLQSCQVASRKLLGELESIFICPGVPRCHLGMSIFDWGKNDILVDFSMFRMCCVESSNALVAI